MRQRSFGESRVKWVGGRVAALVLSVAVGVASAWPAAAVEFFEDNAKFRMNVDTTISVGVSARVEERDPDIFFKGNNPRDRTQGSTESVYTNADDGNLNYDAWDVYSTNGKLTLDLEMDYKVGNKYLTDAGLFARGVGFYDVIGNCVSCTRRVDLAQDARRRASVIYGGITGTQWLFLDAYLDSNWEVLDRYLNFRFGNQVLAWGQTIFYPGGINSIMALDVTKLRTPGSELREGLTPAPMIRLQSDIIGNLSVETYYQWWWNRTQIDPTGSYFSTSDLVGRAAEGLFFGNDPGSGCPAGFPAPAPPTDPTCETNVFGIDKLDDFDPSNQTQWGVALRYYWEAISTDFAFNYVRYHNKIPYLAATAQNFGGVPAPVGYHRDYADNIELIGASFSFEYFSVQWGGEVSYRWHDAAPISTSIQDATTEAFLAGPGSSATVSGFDRVKKVQAQLNFIGNLSGSTRWGVGQVVDFLRVNNIVVIGEGVVVNYPDLEDGVAYAGAPGRSISNTAGAYSLVAQFEYTTPFGLPINFTPFVNWSHDAMGDAPGQFIIQGRKSISVGASINYLNRWIFQMTYANFMGAGDANLQNDRDFLSGSVSFNF